MTRRLYRLAPVALLAAGACVATREDVRILQNDLAVMRAEQARADSLRAAQLEQVIRTLGLTQDTLRALSTRLVRFQGDVAGDLYALQQQVLQVQELTGQSQRRLQELRGALEERQAEISAQMSADSLAAAGAAPGAPGAPNPGPNQLFQLALDQLRRGSAGAARTAFDDLLRQYPSSDVAPDALYYVGESYAMEGKVQAADSVFGAVVARFPESPRAPTAMYKRAVVLRDAKRPDAARQVLEALIQRYPRSEEAELARELQRTLR